MNERIEEIDAVLVEDGRGVMLYHYPAADSQGVTLVSLPIRIEPKNFLRAEWERVG